MSAGSFVTDGGWVLLKTYYGDCVFETVYLDQLGGDLPRGNHGLAVTPKRQQHNALLRPPYNAVTQVITAAKVLQQTHLGESCSAIISRAEPRTQPT